MGTIEIDYDEIWTAVPRDREPPHWGIRSAFCRSLVEPGERVLDLGCGDGAMLPVIAAAGGEPSGADPSRVALERAADTGDFGLRPVEADGTLPWEDDSFDGVWASEVVGQAADAGRVLREAFRVLRAGGWIGLTTPDHGGARRLVPAGGQGRDATTVRRFRQGALARELRECGFERVRVRPAGGRPGWRDLLLASGHRPR
jgi:ubiquinone/menaquinone biosynthesis C-methylase UbiE